MIGQLVTSFIASAGFAVLFHVPRGSLLKCGFVGMLGWLLYLLLQGRGFDTIVASVGASFFVSLLSLFMAKMYKIPVIVFSVSGVIPLVPGGTAYDAMRNVVENHYDIAVQLAAKSFLISGAIAMGLIFSEVAGRLLLRARRRI